MLAWVPKNPATKSYDVYSKVELLSANIEHAQSENEKINKNPDLISFYNNMSTSKVRIKDIGLTVITIILSSICIILAIMYMKNNTRKTR